MKQKIVVVGANHAGTAAINRLVALGGDYEIIVFDKNSNVSFLGCGMALWIGEQITDGNSLFYSSADAMRKNGVEVHMETEVTSVDYEKKVVHYVTKCGKEGEQAYDKLILSTGSTPIIPQLPGLDLKYVQRAKLFQDAQLAVEQIKNDPTIKKVTVIGAGYIGAELAEAYERVGKEVVMIDALDRILGTHFDRDFSDVMAERLKSHGIKIALGEMVQRFEGEGRVQRVVTDKNTYETDLVMMCIGFRPNNALAKDKLELFRNGAILVNKSQETSVKDVYAVGDCATVYDNSIQDTNYIALATNAVRSGIVGAFNAAGTKVESLGVQGSSGLCLYDLKMVCTGKTVESAAKYGIKAKMTEFEDFQKPLFMNEVGPNPKVKIRIVYREDNREIIGAQLMSEYDMSATIHMFSLAIQERVTIDRLALCDIFFMPHFNQPYNYITMAAITAE